MKDVHIQKNMSDSTVNARLDAIVHGHVQGVYFRETTRQRAQQLDLTGWARNEPNGTVRVVAEGQRTALDALIEFLHQGPRAAYVTNVEVSWHTASGEFDTFHVRW